MNPERVPYRSPTYLLYSCFCNILFLVYCIVIFPFFTLIMKKEKKKKNYDNICHITPELVNTASQKLKLGKSDLILCITLWTLLQSFTNFYLQSYEGISIHAHVSIALKSNTNC